MNNLPKVVTQRHLEQDLNSRPVDRKPKRLTRCTTAPPVVALGLQYSITAATSSSVTELKIDSAVIVGAGFRQRCCISCVTRGRRAFVSLET